MKTLINFMRRIVERYDEKNKAGKKPVFTCNNREVRNRNKLSEYQTREGEPMCPVYKDDRCCGGCSLVRTCPYTVDCGCLGFVKAAMGGTDKAYFMRKCSPYRKYGKIKRDGTFDWHYFEFNRMRHRIEPGMFFAVRRHEDLMVPEEVLKEMKEKKLAVGYVVGKMNRKGFLKLDFGLDGEDLENFVVKVHYKGLYREPSDNYEKASYIARFMKEFDVAMQEA